LSISCERGWTGGHRRCRCRPERGMRRQTPEARRAGCPTC
jgi:hypothetical protein